MGSFREAAQGAVDAVAAVFDDWGPTVDKQIRSRSPAAEIIKAANQHDAGPIVVAAGGRGISDAILAGSTASGSSTPRPARSSWCAPPRGRQDRRREP